MFNLIIITAFIGLCVYTFIRYWQALTERAKSIKRAYDKNGTAYFIPQPKCEKIKKSDIFEKGAFGAISEMVSGAKAAEKQLDLLRKMSSAGVSAEEAGRIIRKEFARPNTGRPECGPIGVLLPNDELSKEFKETGKIIITTKPHELEWRTLQDTPDFYQPIPSEWMAPDYIY